MAIEEPNSTRNEFFGIAENVVSDGGGTKQATPRPVVGADKVARFIVGGLTRNDVPLTVEPTVVHAGPALALHVDGELGGVIVMHVEDTRITGLYYVRLGMPLVWVPPLSVSPVPA